MKFDSLMVLSAVSVLLILIGIFLLSFVLFWDLFLILLGISFLVSGLIGVVLARRIVSSIRSKDPEAFEDVKYESLKRSEQEKGVYKAMPRLLLVLLAVVVALGFMGELGIFRFNLFVEIFVLFLVITFLVYYNVKKIEIKKKQNAKTELSS